MKIIPTRSQQSGVSFGKCFGKFVKFFETSLANLNQTVNIIITTGNQVSPLCKDILKFCAYGGVEFDCMQRFRNALTDDGFCCVFNQSHKKLLIKDSKLENATFSIFQIIIKFSFFSTSPQVTRI